jgi:predicted RNA-binding protein YlxR (DUF448 family)
MEAAHTSAPDLQTTPSSEVTVSAVNEDERRCLATGEIYSKDELIRFVIGPADAVVPDLAQNLPGRGLWVKADYDAITTAAKKGLFAKAAKAPAKADPDLANQVIKLLRARCLSFMGMAKGAGITVLGQPQVEAALRAQKLGLLLLAEDAKSELDRRQAVPECHLFSRDELGAALGYAQIVYAGLNPHGLTKRLSAEIHRLTRLTETSPKADGNG